MRACGASTVVTKLYSTSTFHWNTTSCPFYPEFAVWTLLKLCTCNKLFKFFVSVTEGIVYPKLIASHFVMIVAFTVQAIFLFTNRTSIHRKLTIMSKYSRTSCSWTPWSKFILILNIMIKTKFLIFYPCLPINIVKNFIWQYIRSTTRRTWYIYFSIINKCLNMLINTFFMEHMPTFQ